MEKIYNYIKLNYSVIIVITALISLVSGALILQGDLILEVRDFSDGNIYYEIFKYNEGSFSSFNDNIPFLHNTPRALLPTNFSLMGCI